jgi:hypothetical protein
MRRFSKHAGGPSSGVRALAADRLEDLTLVCACDDGREAARVAGPERAQPATAGAAD